MRRPGAWMATAGLLLIGLALWSPLLGDDAAQARTSVKTVVAPREVREYQIDAVIKGKAPSPESAEPVDLDTAFRLKVRHHYSRREGDGLLPLEISLVEGQMTVPVVVDGKKLPQTLQITPSIYPKLTVLIDSDWRIDDIFGLTGDRAGQRFPGISYGNHIIVFFPQGLDQPRAPGDKWESTLKIAGLGETYSFTTTLVRQEVIDGVRTAVVRQEILRPLKEDAEGIGTSMKATAESAFAIDGGKLVKSHVDCDVTFSGKRQDRPTSRANIKIDISLAK